MLGGCALMIGAPVALAEPLRALSEAEAIAAVTAPADKAQIRSPINLGTLNGHPVILGTRCCERGAPFHVLYFDLNDSSQCAAWGGDELFVEVTDVGSGEVGNELFCMPPTVRYAQEVAGADPLTDQDIARFGGPDPDGTLEIPKGLVKWRGVLVHVERHYSDAGGFHTINVWLDLPKGASCKEAGGVAQYLTTGLGFAPTTGWYCVPKPYDDAMERRAAGGK